jgi:hypothetical protein
MNLSRADVAENTATDDRGARLVGWKDIAAYLGKTDRTVKRWGRDRGLPVHRVPGAAKTSVYAYASEVDRWLESARGSEREDVREPEENAAPVMAGADRREVTVEPGLRDNGSQDQGLRDQRMRDLGPQARSRKDQARRWLLAGLALLLAAVGMDVVVRLRAVPLAG